jgi:hypothetical protein
MNPAALFKIKSDWETFTRNHPKFPMFLSALGNTPIPEGSVIEINVTTPEGKNMCTNVKLTASDLEMIKNLKNMAGEK